MNQSTYFNYNLPQPNDMADISKINANFTNLDAYLHRTIGENYSNPDTLDARVSAVETGANLEKSATNSFDDGIDSYFKKLVSTIMPVQAGSGTPSPTNERPIFGFTECVVTDCGKNRCNAQNPIVLSQAGNIGEQSCGISAGTYTFSWTSSAKSAISLTLYNGSTLIGTFASLSAIQGRGNLTFTITEDVTSLKCYFNSATTVSDIQVELGSTATNYTPYVAPNTATISFGSAGTVYGGYVDLISGKLVVNYAEVDLGSLTWTIITPASGVYLFVAPISDMKVDTSQSGRLNVLCSHFKTPSSIPPTWGDIENYSCLKYYGDNRIIVKDTDYTDATAFKTAMNGVQLVYDLETPQEYQLTPAQLRSLVGTNNLTSSTGEVTEVEYITNETIAWLLDLIRAN